MSLERVRRILQRESLPFEPNHLQTMVLTVGAQWRMEGKPWWSVGTMNLAIANMVGKSPNAFRLIDDVHTLANHGALETKNGFLEDLDKLEPFCEVPQSDNDRRNYLSFYSISDEGVVMRKGRVI